MHEQVAAARRLLSAIELDGFDCRGFENPSLQKHYAGLQAIALDERSVRFSAAACTAYTSIYTSKYVHTIEVYRYILFSICHKYFYI